MTMTRRTGLGPVPTLMWIVLTWKVWVPGGKHNGEGAIVLESCQWGGRVHICTLVQSQQCVSSPISCNNLAPWSGRLEEITVDENL